MQQIVVFQGTADNRVRVGFKSEQPDVLLLQELKGTEFPSRVFELFGYESASVTQKTYNGVAILSRHPIEPLNTTLVGDETDSHARFLEVMVQGIRMVNIYLPNGNPVGSDRFSYKLAWMKRLHQQMTKWRTDNVPTLVGGDFNVIPEDIDCHKPSSWERDALFQPEPRAAYRALLGLGYTDAFRSLHVGEGGISLSGITSGRLSYTTEAYASIIFCCRPRSPSDSKNVRSINVREPSKNHPITLP